MSLFVSQRIRRRLKAAAGGKLELADPRAARALVHELGAGERGAALLHALSLLEEAVGRLLGAAARRAVLEQAARAVERELGRERLAGLLQRFAAEFGLAAPPAAARRGRRRAKPAKEKKARPRQERRRKARQAGRAAAEPAAEATPPVPPELVRELMIFWWLRANPALEPVFELIDDSGLADSEELAAAGRAFREVLAAAPGLEPGGGSLLADLEAPLEAAPDSAVEQLRWLLARWRGEVGELERRITTGLDLAAEERAPRFPPGPGPVEPPSWEAAGSEARYSPDRDWMPRVVMLAKNALVWLGQLAAEHGRPVARLDEIPDEELARIAGRGFNALWLIGLWERSAASREIKRLCGNPEAEASAYSLRSYRIARRLGGEAALDELRERAARHGLRLAADMVPNHAGIDSDWVLEHPERFISERQCPFPSYTFDGPDLTPDSPAAIHLEDHYFDRSDAAVVFRRTDRATGAVRYLYHGNDGTSMPWNDTAQLDYLEQETREAVIRQILKVARRFPVIRFDAAMTLTRHHFRRLWYPKPGEAGAIPSRAERGLTSKQFDERMPREFWREVVERLTDEAPDTLLIAEAFWLLEGYFVRVLGMHRVYNSAFMNMLRDGDVAGYRKLLGEILGFDPALLERFVNFMSNPDEKTAAEQFGSGDRYRAVCLLLATLPGLPMFAHGQVEGFREHYGMEYQRSYHDERPDPRLVAWHEETLAPLLARRELFAASERFELFDLEDAKGEVVESVLAFANGAAGERLLVAANLADRRARGRLQQSVPRAEAGAGEREAGERPPAASAPLTEALALDPVRQRHVLRDRLGGGEIEVDYRTLVDEGLELDLAPWQVRILSPAG